MNVEEYLPYEEWWDEDSNFKTFVQHDLQYALIGFYENLKENKLPNKSRREWMDMFLLWLEYRKDRSIR
jgi:hypothetical protein